LVVQKVAGGAFDLRPPKGWLHVAIFSGLAATSNRKWS